MVLQDPSRAAIECRDRLGAGTLGGIALSLALILTISLSPRFPVAAGPDARLFVDGKVLKVEASAATVAEALSAAGVSLDADDQVFPATTAPVPADGRIRVTRIRFEEGAVDKPVRYQTLIRPASRGNRPYHPTVMRHGRNGLKRITYRAKLVDGKETERTTVSEEMVREPVPEVVVARNPAGLKSRGAYIGKREFLMVCTAYDPGPGSCGKWADGITCNGKRAGYGIIAVDPKVIPLGTKLHVPGYGYGVAADVGGAIKGNRLDLGYNSRQAAFRWGKKRVKVSIVD